MQPLASVADTALGAPSTDVLERLRAALPSLSARSRQAASFILANPERVVQLSASQLAAETGTSVGTVVRLCHAAGLAGIHELKLRLVSLLGRERIARGLPTDRPGAQTLADIVDDLCRTATALDHGAVERAAATLRQATRILIVSSGTSQPLAIEFGNWLNSIGRAVAYPTDGGTQEAVARQLGPHDVCFAISHSGTTAATLDPVRTAMSHGALTIALTSYSGAPLVDLAHDVIIAGASASHARGDEMASRMVHHAVLQVLRSLLSTPSALPAPTADHV